MGWLTALREDAYPAALAPLSPSASFDLATAGAMAWAAQLAYEVETPDKLARILQRWNWQLERPLTHPFASTLPLTSTRGFVATADGMRVIAFSGTEPTELFDWTTNFAIGRTDAGIHDGFYAGVAAVWTDIKDSVAGWTGPIRLTGHSLGGALAVVCAYRLIAENVAGAERIAGVHTIGMPRVGDAAFAADYNGRGGGALGERTFRLIHGADIVPRVPPVQPPFGFRHFGRALSCAQGGAFRAEDLGPVAVEAATAPPAPGALSFALPAGGGLPPYPGANPIARPIVEMFPPPVRDHIPDRYLRALGIL